MKSSGGFRQQVSIDTQFRVGPYYVTVLTIRVPYLRNRISGAYMILPVAMVLHDKKFQIDHQLAFDIILRAIPQLGSKMFLATSDQGIFDFRNIRL